MDDLLRVYFDPTEIGPDGYPFAWHGRGATGSTGAHGAPSVGSPGYPVAVKDLIREQAGNRCERCGHPYMKGQGLNDGWSECDEHCTHGGPIRYRDSHLGDHDEWRRRDVIHTTTAEARLDELPHGLGVRWDIQAQWRILTVHHLNGIKHDLRWWNLAALCQRCHLTIQAKVLLERPYDRPHTEWFKPHAAGYYASEGAAELLPANPAFPERKILLGDGPEPTREWVLERMEAILAVHATQGVLL